MSDDERVWCYGTAGTFDDAPCIARRCPHCGRFLRVRGSRCVFTHLGDRVHFEGVRCAKCGPVDPDIACWRSDLADAD